MEKSNLTPSMVIAVALVASSLILSYSLGRLGDDVIAAGIHSRKVSLEQANNGRPLRVLLEDDSELEIKTDPN